MIHSTNHRLWGETLIVLLLVAFVASLGTGQVLFKHPQPQEIYKEYSRTMMPWSDWRVTDPNTHRPSAQIYLPNAVLGIGIDDLQGAVRAEAVIDLWGGHAGTYGKAMRFNSHDWISIPELQTTPGDGQCYHSQPNIVVDIPLADLVQGTNWFEGKNAGQTCYTFDWGQFGWNAIIIRVYYNSSKPHPTGSITSPAAGGTLGENPTIYANASSSAGIRKIDFIAYYDGVDEDGDGVYQDWHYYYHRAKWETELHISGQVGTATSAPFQTTWNTDLVPDQSAGGIKLQARIQDNNGVWFVTDKVENISLQRGGVSVQLYKPYGVPERFLTRLGESQFCYYAIPGAANLAAAVKATLIISTFNGIDGLAHEGETHSYYLNYWSAPEFGVDHLYSLDYLNINNPSTALSNGVNTFEAYSQSSETGIYVHWPGPQLVVRYNNGPVPVQLSSFTARSAGGTSVRLDWTTLSETNNYGFEVQKATSPTGSYTTIPNSFVGGHGTSLVRHDYSFTDANASPGVFYYRLNQIDLDKSNHFSDPVRVDNTTGVVEPALPTKTTLAQNYPNPFNPSTVIRYGVAQKGQVMLTVYNALGEQVATLVNGEKAPGYYEVKFAADNLAAGIYFYRLVAGAFVQTNKLVLVR